MKELFQKLSNVFSFFKEKRLLNEERAKPKPAQAEGAEPISFGDPTILSQEEYEAKQKEREVEAAGAVESSEEAIVSLGQPTIKTEEEFYADRAEQEQRFDSPLEQPSAEIQALTHAASGGHLSPTWRPKLGYISPDVIAMRDGASEKPVKHEFTPIALSSKAEKSETQAFTDMLVSLISEQHGALITKDIWESEAEPMRELLIKMTNNNKNGEVDKMIANYQKLEDNEYSIFQSELLNAMQSYKNNPQEGQQQLASLINKDEKYWDDRAYAARQARNIEKEAIAAAESEVSKPIANVPVDRTMEVDE